MSTAMSFTCPNYSGTLYTKSNINTPFLNAIGAPRYTNSVKFATSQDYALEDPSQPEISEEKSVNGVEPTFITRKQEYNVTQIFQEAVSVSYAKESNMGTMSGINIAGQQPDPETELQFQKAAKMRKIANDIEYTFLRGTYNEATKDSEANRTRGLLEAIKTNAVQETAAVGSGTLRSVLSNFLKTMFDNGANPGENTIFVNSLLKQAISEAYTGSSLLYPNGVTQAGANIVTLVSDFGTNNIILAPTIPQNVLLCCKTDACHPVEQITPGKGNFFYEDKPAAGAAYNGMIFGQIGLDYGCEFLHGKLVFPE